ncbi:MAG TPA: hypothetical protein VEL76_07615 [Gemmataceae bacterium]|nr:hypothetical protein [Gemmataceae bacterium]
MAIVNDLQEVSQLASQLADQVRALGGQLAAGWTVPVSTKINTAHDALIGLRDMIGRVGAAAPQVESFSERAQRITEETMVAAHYDSFSETFQRLHTSKEEFLEGFRAARRMKPGLTGEQFVRPARS